MRTAAICPTCATYENAVCVIYNGPTLSNINVPPLTDLQTALGSVDASVASLTALINSVAANPIFLTVAGTSGPASLSGNVLTIPNYQPPLDNVLGYGNHTDSSIFIENNISSPTQYTEINNSYVTVTNGTSGGTVGTGYFYISTSSGSGQIQGSDLTGNRTYELPDTDGTIALTSDITLQTVTSGTNKNLTNGFNFQGTGAGDNNTGTSDINAFGLDAAKNNSGAIVNAFGKRAAQDNEGANVTAFGTDSANLNTGSYVNGIGGISLYNNSGSYVNAMGPSAGANNTYSYVNLLGYSASASANNQLALSKDQGSQMARIGYGGITADRLYTLPDNDGTIALISDIPGYKVYTAVISQTGTGAPTVDYVLKNTLGFTPTFSYDSVGQYAIFNGSFAWTNNKTIVFLTPGFPNTSYVFGWDRASSSYLYLYTTNSTNNTFTNSCLNKVSIEIRVYP